MIRDNNNFLFLFSLYHMARSLQEHTVKIYGCKQKFAICTSAMQKQHCYSYIIQIKVLKGFFKHLPGCKILPSNKCVALL